MGPDITEMAVHETNYIFGIVIQRAAFVSDTVRGWIVPGPWTERRDFRDQNCSGGVLYIAQLHATETG